MNRVVKTNNFCKLASSKNTSQAFKLFKWKATSKCNYATLRSIMFDYARLVHKIKSCDFQFSILLKFHLCIPSVLSFWHQLRKRTWNYKREHIAICNMLNLQCGGFLVPMPLENQARNALSLHWSSFMHSQSLVKLPALRLACLVARSSM